MVTLAAFADTRCDRLSEALRTRDALAASVSIDDANLLLPLLDDSVATLSDFLKPSECLEISDLERLAPVFTLFFEGDDRCISIGNSLFLEFSGRLFLEDLCTCAAFLGLDLLVSAYDLEFTPPFNHRFADSMRRCISVRIFLNASSSSISIGSLLASRKFSSRQNAVPSLLNLLNTSSAAAISLLSGPVLTPSFLNCTSKTAL
mmetsp:Transcript_1951/g.3211  ORF Transcript_1951/g.3211 Transcript_1951/m.3211 type:complete len:204 (+) Transcript_1951:1096-1707(+)